MIYLIVLGIGYGLAFSGLMLILPAIAAILTRYKPLPIRKTAFCVSVVAGLVGCAIIFGIVESNGGSRHPYLDGLPKREQMVFLGALAFAVLSAMISFLKFAVVRKG
jgi:hypothetical protein